MQMENQLRANTTVDRQDRSNSVLTKEGVQIYAEVPHVPHVVDQNITTVILDEFNIDFQAVCVDHGNSTTENSPIVFVEHQNIDDIHIFISQSPECFGRKSWCEVFKDSISGKGHYQWICWNTWYSSFFAAR